ncbi:thymidylate kinase [Stomoxys calcitrans]|uniref:Thymidylate kinase n=1 Tax=Stomoxys calcitrans TaxID=35570 RepID=A0A1I8Q3P3_STOCA|nr:thymidylate kinase [Stomoxys calcitrans]
MVSGSIKRGAFIVLEGCDRCGKSTQSRSLVEFLQNNSVPVKYMAFPERTSNIGQVINAYLTNKQQLNDETIHLLFTANRWEHKNEIIEQLNSGTTLVVDRYSYSGIAYSTAKGMSKEWCMGPETGLPRPDLVFYLKTSIDALLDRGNFGEERYEREEFQQKVGKVFDDIYNSEKSYWYEIDASQPKEVIHSIIKEKALQVLKEVETTATRILKWTEKYHADAC